MSSNVIGINRDDFNEWSDQIMEEAYKWAVSEQRIWGLHSDFMNLIFDSDWYSCDKNKGECTIKKGYVVKDDCIYSLFVSKKEDRTVLRIDWPQRMVVKYHDVVNYDELCEVAPNSVRSMRANAIRLSKEFDDNGGVYRYMGW